MIEMEELKPCPYIGGHSGVDGNGQEYISVVLKEPEIDESNLYVGGLRMAFENNHKKQRAEAYLYHYHHGAPQYIRTIKTWKGEVLAESECLKYAVEYMRKPEQEENHD